jgi:hypothetical protein
MSFSTFKLHLPLGLKPLLRGANPSHIHNGSVHTSAIYERTHWCHQSEWRIDERGSRGVRIHAAVARVKQLIASRLEV